MSKEICLVRKDGGALGETRHRDPGRAAGPYPNHGRIKVYLEMLHR